MTDRSAFAPALGLPGRLRHPVLATLAVAVAAVGLVSLVGIVLTWVFGLAVAPPPPPKNPFGIGIREGGGSATGLVGWILAVQSQFYAMLTGALRQMKADGSAFWMLCGVSFLYGVFHAAGPGHGKAVISAYIVANERALGRGIAMSAAAALLQAIVAVGLVTLLAGILRFTAAKMTSVTQAVEIASFAAVALVGAVLLWRKAGSLARLWNAGPGGEAPSDPDCGHAHLPEPEEAMRLSRRERLAAIVAAGIRPCSGAIIVLVFALSQGLYPAGIAATFAMAAGTAITTGLLAAVSVFFKGAALRMADGRGDAGLLLTRGLEVLAAAFVLVLGLALLSGVWGWQGA
jgi:ABC-type nickel/cobalt efflux system permease component RcnA